MISAINNQPQPAFQAKLRANLGCIPNGEKIINKFESITQHYKNDVFEVATPAIEIGDTGKTFKGAIFLTNGEDTGYMLNFGDFKRFCKTHTPEQVAKSLAKVFKIGKLAEKTNKQIAEIDRNLKSANLTLFRAQTGTPTHTNQTLANNSQQRIATLKEKLADLNAKQLATEQRIIKDDPIEKDYWR